MGFFKKFRDLAMANLNAWLDRIEDPQKMAELMLTEISESQKKAKKLLEKALASLKEAEKRHFDIGKKIKALEKIADDYLRHAEENKAKIALNEKLELSRLSQALAEQIANEKKAIMSIKKGLSALDEKASHVRSAAIKAAAQQAVEDEDAFSIFDRMSEKIGQSEGEIEALRELLAAEEKKDAGGQAPPTSYDKYSDPDAMEKELNRLKKKIKN